MELISVALPNYNGGLFLSEAINSILKQTYSEFELIIVDDASVDNSVEIIESFEDKRIKLIKLKKNGGIVNALNTAINESKGGIIARMNSDDISHPERFEKCMNVFFQNPEVGVVGTWMETFGRDKQLWKYHDTNEKLKQELWFGSPIPHPASMFRVSVLREANIQYESDFPHMEDYLFFYNLSKFTSFYIVPEVLFNYRLHQSNITGLNRSSFQKRLIEIQSYILVDSRTFVPNRRFSEILYQVSAGNILHHSPSILLNWLRQFKMVVDNDDLQPVLNEKWKRMLYKIVDLRPLKGFVLAFRSGFLNFLFIKYFLTRVLGIKP